MTLFFCPPVKLVFTIFLYYYTVILIYNTVYFIFISVYFIIYEKIFEINKCFCFNILKNFDRIFEKNLLTKIRGLIVLHS